MASRLFFTAERSLEIEQSSVTSGLVDVHGNLILSTRGGTEIDAGNVADVTGITAALETKANVADMTPALAAKANVADMTPALAAKANVADMTPALAAKVNVADMTPALAAKVSTANLTAEMLSRIPAHERVHTYTWGTSPYTAASLPSAYPLGITIEETGGSGWPINFSTVETVCVVSPFRVTQRLTSLFGNITYIRTGNGSANVWSQWVISGATANVALTAGWSQIAGLANCQVTLGPGGIVNLQGAIRRTGATFTSGAGTFAVVPVGYRPAAVQYVPCSKDGGPASFVFHQGGECQSEGAATWVQNISYIILNASWSIYA